MQGAAPVGVRSQTTPSQARKAGLNRESLYKSLSGEGNPAFSTIKKITKVLGIHLVAQPAQ
ncbi:helix-turn-helix domain-containing transcriptional regulator [Desulfocicer vacuolatum]|uniref:helix-turn-helix domain-containing transcriptional regulator n=1 Tax=Desulfocicer vacuolatum TaxID=2298 RepID=UPI000A066728